MDAHDKLARAAALMEKALIDATGLQESARKIVVYWTLATRSLRYESSFPIIALLGKMGTGKSQTLSIIENFAFRPVRLSLRGMTTPTIRDKFAEAFNGTAIVEEADSAWRDADSTFEALLSDRYQRASAKASHKVPSGDKAWATAHADYFGATALHRRIPFKDAALDGRTVSVRFRADHSRQYREFRATDAWNKEGCQLLLGVEFEPVEVAQPEGVAGRVFNTFKPLLSAANACGDPNFAEQLRSRLLQETLELKEAQSSEPDSLVLQAIVEKVLPNGHEVQFHNIRLSGLAEAVWDNHKISLSPRQIGRIARELGFETTVSHGATVVVPTLATLLHACDECEYSDEAIEELRRGTFLGEPGQSQP
jgi:hypothetical protein